MYRRAWLALVAGLLLVLSAGCSGQVEPPQVEVTPDVDIPVEFVDEISFADLLTKSRAVLALQAEDVQAKIDLLDKKHRLAGQPFRRLPDLHLPLATPVFRDAKYSETLGFSVPPYLPEGAKDSGLALHLARFGDVEAARKLVEPGDTATRAQIDALAGPKNYPVEWTRLVSLLLHNAQFHFVAEEQFKPGRLISLHEQLVKVLDAKARAGPLGAALLPRGHFVLKRMAARWRAHEVTELAEIAEAGLKDWGEFSVPTTPVLPSKTTRAEIARLLGVADAPSRRALQPTAVARALDVLNLPLPGDDAENVVACFDPAGILTDLLVLYRTRQSERVPQPGQLAHYLEESVPPRQVQTVTHDGLTRRRYTLPAGVWEAALTPHNFAVGAVVRFSDGQPAGSATLPRTLGDVQLDQSFEQNRLRIALHQQGNPLVLENADDLKHVANPVPGLTLTQAALHRADPHDLPARLALQWTAEQKAQRSLAKLAVPLFAVAGTPHIEAGGGPEGQLTLSWQDARTRWTLRLPNKVEIGPSLEVADRTPPDQLARTAATVREREAAERRQRITAGTPRQRLNREVEGVALGQGRTAVTARFPADDQAAVLALPDVLAVRFLRPAVGGLVWQELEARFDADKKVAEVRFRFRDGSGKAGAVARKLETFKQKYGAPQVLPAPWATVWSARGKAVLYRWQDDTTVVTWQQDGSGVELTVRDCPAAHPAGVPLPPLTVLARGLDGCHLGDARTDVLARFTHQKPAQPGGPWQLTPARDSSHDVVLVWFDNDRVSRVLARHAVASAKVVGPDAMKLVTDVWNQQLAQFGWPRRQEINAERLLECQGNHDDRTRVRVFWRKEQGGGSLYTEWLELTP